MSRTHTHTHTHTHTDVVSQAFLSFFLSADPLPKPCYFDCNTVTPLGQPVGKGMVWGPLAFVIRLLAELHW